MSLASGTRVGPYQIVGAVGAGGMGEVYRAHDPRTGRNVAIKIAAEKFSERFSREVHAVAALNHPNICHLYDVGPNYLVMELVEGPTLAERIREGPVPFEEALFISRQIGSALEAAHEKGIVHRDLKPANIKLAPDGTVKVLDFGLAKHSREGEGADPDNSPTLTLDAATRAGTILGTAAYMSPEQARGKNVDKRADIWAFGVVLYELFTGERLFKGSDVSEILAAVIKEDPKLDKVPRRARRLVAKCLVKDPRQRLRDIGDAWDLLDDTQPQEAGAGKTSIVGWVMAAILFIAFGALAFLHFRPASPSRTLRTKIELPGNGSAPMFAISADGRSLVISALVDGKAKLFLRPLDASEAQLIPGTEGATYPFWSPDGRYIAFYAQNKLKKILTSGGPPQTLCDAANGRGGSWSLDGGILFSTDEGGAFAIRRVNAGGGAPAEIVKPPKGIARYPVILPDGQHFLYVVTRASAEENGIYFRSLDGKENRRILSDESSVTFAAGRLLFVRENTLMAQSFDPEHGQTSGDPTPLARNVSLTQNVVYAPVTASENGILVYQTGGTALGNNQLTWYDRGGKILGTLGPLSPVNEPTISPDQKQVMFMRLSNTGSDLGLWDLSRGTEQPFHKDPTIGGIPAWSPAMDRILFVSNRMGGIYNFFIKPLNGAGQEELFYSNETRKTLDQWSHDGKFVVYSQLDPKTRLDLWVLPVDQGKPGKPIAFLHSESNESLGQLSPDSRWMAYTSDETGRREVYVRSFPSGEAPTKVSIDGAEEPRWRGDGKELYFIAADGKVMSAAIKENAGAKPALSPGAPQALFAAPPLAHYTPETFDYDVTRDGSRFLLNSPATGQASAAPLDLVLNWEAALRR